VGGRTGHDEQHQVGSLLRPPPALPRGIGGGGDPAAAAGGRRAVPLDTRSAAEAQDPVAQCKYVIPPPSASLFLQFI